jgi:hypothetical protein
MNGSKPYGPSDDMRTSGEALMWFAQRASPFPSPRPSPLYMFSVAFTSVAAAILAAVEGGILPPGLEVRYGSGLPNHTPIPPGRMPGSTAGKMPAARLNTYSPLGRGRILRCLSAQPNAVSARRTSRTTKPDADYSLSPWERVRVRGIGLPFDTAIRTIPEIVEVRESSGRAGGFPRG